MEIAILVLLFIVGTVASAFQAMRYLERRQHKGPAARRRSRED
jgi:hypothetical protein